MTATLRAMNCGWQTGPLGLFLEGEHGKIRVPTPAFLIEHPKGRVLFDSGLHRSVRTDPAAALVVQRREWEAGHVPETVASNYYDPRNYDLGHALRLVDGEHDLFGDGSVTCLPTHGHTPGHQSLRVRTARGDVVLTADCFYLRRTLDASHLPAVAHDRDAMLRSLDRLRALRTGGARLVFGHDPEQWREITAAPAAF